MATDSGKTGWFSYWLIAWRSRPPAKRFLMWRAVPSVMIPAAVWIYKSQTGSRVELRDLLLTVVAGLSIYFILWLCEVSWNGLVIGPAVVYESQLRIIADLTPSPIEQLRRELLVRVMEKFPDEERAVLKAFLVSGGNLQATMCAMGNEYSDHFMSALNRARQAGLVGNDHDRGFKLIPEMESAMAFFFRKD